MIAIPAYVLLAPFAIFMAGYVFFAFANVLSLAKYGARNGIGLVASFIFIAGTVLILFLAWQSLATTDWKTSLDLGGAASSPLF
jgi:hypothetical protein